MRKKRSRLLATFFLRVSKTKMTRFVSSPIISFQAKRVRRLTTTKRRKKRTTTTPATTRRPIRTNRCRLQYWLSLNSDQTSLSRDVNRTQILDLTIDSSISCSLSSSFFRKICFHLLSIGLSGHISHISMGTTVIQYISRMHYNRMYFAVKNVAGTGIRIRDHPTNFYSNGFWSPASIPRACTSLKSSLATGAALLWSFRSSYLRQCCSSLAW